MPSTSTDRAVSHISHFMWCRSAADAVKDTYSETGNSADDILFTNVAGFTVNGLGNWYAPSHDEMDYLLMSRKASTVGGTANARYFSGRIDKGSGNYANGLFVIPDVFAWPESELPNAPKGINQYRYNYTGSFPLRATAMARKSPISPTIKAAIGRPMRAVTTQPARSSCTSIVRTSDLAATTTVFPAILSASSQTEWNNRPFTHQTAE